LRKWKLLVALAGLAVVVAAGVVAAPEPQATDASSAFVGSRAGDEVAGVKLCWCPPGRFRMGSPADEPERRLDEGQVEVTLTRGFWMGKYEATQGQWNASSASCPES
jgi:formylglycine-generating enzyme required for sulfatase activity